MRHPPVAGAGQRDWRQRRRERTRRDAGIIGISDKREKGIAKNSSTVTAAGTAQSKSSRGFILGALLTTATRLRNLSSG
jgi:hypothetical protein